MQANPVQAVPIIISNYTSALVRADKFFDTTPLSCINNIVDLFIKIVVLNAVKIIKGDAWKTNYYFRHIDAKNFIRVVTLSLPGVGFIIVGLYDRWNNYSANALFKKARELEYKAANENNFATQTSLKNEAKETYLRAANAGHEKAINFCAQQTLYAGHYENAQKNIFEMVENIALAGNKEALDPLGAFFEFGISVPKNAEKAHELYKKAHEKPKATPITYSSLTSFLVRADQIMDRTPGSIVNNIVDLFMKIVVLNAVKIIKGDAWKTNYYFRHIDAKSFGRIITLSIPGGFIGVALYDIWNNKSSQNLLNVAIKAEAEALTENQLSSSQTIDAKYLKAAEAGNAEAIICIANQVYFSDNTYFKNDEVFEMVEKLAFSGNAIAQNRLATFFEKGTGVARDTKRAFEWYEKSAAQDNLAAIYSVGFCQMKGQGTTKDEKKGIENLTKAANKGASSAMYDLGIYFSQNRPEKNLKTAFEWFDKGAKDLHLDCMHERGKCYYFGLGTSRDDKKAYKDFQGASGHSMEAKYYFGACYIHGIGRTPDKKIGEDLQREALAAGYTPVAIAV